MNKFFNSIAFILLSLCYAINLNAQSNDRTSTESTYQPTIDVNGWFINPTSKDVVYLSIPLKIKGDKIIGYSTPFTHEKIECNIPYHQMTTQEKSQMKLFDSKGRSYELYVGDCQYKAQVGKLTVYFASNKIGDNFDNTVYLLSEVDSKPTLDLKKYGTSDLIQFIQKRIGYPIEAADKNIQGKVVVTFIVNVDGTISDIKVIQSAHRLLDNAVKNAIRKITKCEPAIKNNKEVITIIEFPFTFKLAE